MLVAIIILGVTCEVLAAKVTNFRAEVVSAWHWRLQMIAEVQLARDGAIEARRERNFWRDKWKAAKPRDIAALPTSIRSLVSGDGDRAAGEPHGGVGVPDVAGQPTSFHYDVAAGAALCPICFAHDPCRLGLEAGDLAGRVPREDLS
jgi:hypothetical protein